MMAPDSNKVVPFFRSWIAAHNGYQQRAAARKQEVTGKAKCVMFRIAGCLPIYQEGVRSD